MITLVYAQEEKGGIGYRNQLPWSLPNDLKFFKETTMGHTMLMGRKTFDSMGQRQLPGRKTVVLTRDPHYGEHIPGLAVVHSVEAAMAQYPDLMVIGGAEVFALCLPYADCIIRTTIDAAFPADTWMPAIDEQVWHCQKVVQGQQDEKNQYPHQFEWWYRIATKGEMS